VWNKLADRAATKSENAATSSWSRVPMTPPDRRRGERILHPV